MLAGNETKQEAHVEKERLEREGPIPDDPVGEQLEREHRVEKWRDPEQPANVETLDLCPPLEPVHVAIGEHEATEGIEQGNAEANWVEMNPSGTGRGIFTNSARW